MKNNLDFYDIYDYYTQPIYELFWFRLFIVFLLIGLMLLVSFFVYRRINKKKLTSWQLALIELEKISLNKFNKKEDFKKFYFVLTKIVKDYLQMRYTWQIRDLTDEELIDYLKNKNFDTEYVADLQKLKESSLLVKFADESILRSQAEKDLKLVFDFINKTIPKDA